MIQILYASAASEPFPSAALTALLVKARLRNAVCGVTGMLLYQSGSFMQVLEGPEAGVDVIYTSILRDPRHNRARIIRRGSIARREFGEWSMGFADTSEWSRQTPGHINSLRAIPELAVARGEAARRYLSLFQDGLYRESLSV